MNATTETSAGTAPAVPWDEAGTVPVTGGYMHWAKIGSGPPLVLMPKVGGWIADWRHVAKLLAEDYQVILIDPPGHGGSKMFGEPPFVISQEHSAAAVMMVLDMLGIERFAAAGNSMGGMILLAASMIWPDRISQLCMVSSSLIYPVSMAELQEKAARRDGIYDSDFSYETVDAMFSLTRETYDEFVLSQRAAGDWKDPNIRGVALSGPMQFLPRSDAPTMLLYGGRGTIYSKYAPEAQRLRPDIRIETVSDCGSFVHQDRPDETYALMRDFFE
ncbi:alpha/beta hydrolase [Parasphingopyxis algicola]|uniref:alpha/beta fold hydrolase n=1 Tax=Parasphingopyxis algicola TaxID=2026624 RepID=UPI0015A2EE06|nr:alpha/beta hydrolase [Parasphingopyxis algicola]QLC26402.1 alpha/beta hydrolase [Parasphingopyxis algicola]